MKGTTAVSSSKVAMKRFRETLKDVEEFEIEVKDTTPYDWS